MTRPRFARPRHATFAAVPEDGSFNRHTCRKQGTTARPRGHVTGSIARRGYFRYRETMQSRDFSHAMQNLISNIETLNGTPCTMVSTNRILRSHSTRGKSDRFSRNFARSTIPRQVHLTHHPCTYHVPGPSDRAREPLMSDGFAQTA